MGAADRSDELSGPDGHSHYEPRAFGALRATLRTLGREFPDAALDVVKPAFESDTALGPCLPDFAVEAERHGGRPFFPVEVMGFLGPGHLDGKEVTHPRMATLGPLCTMDAAKFDGSGRVTSEGRQNTASIRRVLRERWRR